MEWEWKVGAAQGGCALATDDAIDPERAGLTASSDQELLRRMQADELDAFEAFFVRYRSPIYRTAYGLTGDVHAAEEILQDTFARAYQRRATLRTDVSPLPWLHKVALNLCYSRLSRRRPAQQPIVDQEAQALPDDSIAPAERAEQAELRQIVRDGVAALPMKHQAVVVLYYLYGMSLQETAALLNVRLGTVKSRLHYALRSLRTQLEGDNRFRGAYQPATAHAFSELAAEEETPA